VIAALRTCTTRNCRSLFDWASSMALRAAEAAARWQICMTLTARVARGTDLPRYVEAGEAVRASTKPCGLGLGTALSKTE